MATKKQALDAIIKELNEQIRPLEEKRAQFHQLQLNALDFSDKNYYSSVQQNLEDRIKLISSTKRIVKKHLK